MIFGRETKNHQMPRVVEKYELDDQGGTHVTVSLETEDVFWGKTEVVLEKADSAKMDSHC